MDKYSEYSEIKRLVDEYFVLQDDRSYLEFIKKLVDIMQI